MHCMNNIMQFHVYTLKVAVTYKRDAFCYERNTNTYILLAVMCQMYCYITI